MTIRKRNVSQSQHLDRVLLSHFKLTKDKTILAAESKSKRSSETGVTMKTIVRPVLVFVMVYLSFISAEFNTKNSAFCPHSVVVCAVWFVE